MQDYSRVGIAEVTKIIGIFYAFIMSKDTLEQ